LGYARNETQYESIYLFIVVCSVKKALKQKEEELAREVNFLKQKLDEVENLANARGLTGVFNFRANRKIESTTSATPAS
jgi:hypothetical protein